MYLSVTYVPRQVHDSESHNSCMCAKLSTVEADTQELWKQTHKKNTVRKYQE